MESRCLNYRIQGAKDPKGFTYLGLVEFDKGYRGKLSAKLTTLGKLSVSSNAINAIKGRRTNVFK
jgi:hypothetical protein